MNLLTLVVLMHTAFAAPPKQVKLGFRYNVEELKDEKDAAVSFASFKDASLVPEKLPVIEGLYRQKVDHFGKQKGVNGTWFNQLYFVQDAYYKPGGPIFFYIQGEAPADKSFLEGGFSILDHLLPRYNGMAVSLEHRFYGANADPSFPGRSVPTADLSPESLKLLTASQAIADNARFIENFPSMFPKYKIPKKTKWITIDLIYAAHASSAPVQLQMNFWKYSYAVDEGIKFWADVKYNNGQACVNGWTRAVSLLDNGLVNASKDPVALKEFKSKFWMSQVNAIADVGATVASDFALTVQYHPSSELVGEKMALELVCGGVEIPAFTNATATDADLLKALQDYTIAKMQAWGITGDDDPNVGLWFNPTTVPSTDYSFAAVSPLLWYYQSCNEFGYAQVAQPLTKEGLIESWSVYSQFNTVAKYEQWCRSLGFTKNSTIPAINANNKKYGGLWNYQSNILFTNGAYDPWHYLSNYKTVANPPTQVTLVLKNATHCHDLFGPLDRTQYGTQISQTEDDEFFGQVFATYDKWIHG
ncbi:UNVERIFIED_CONTAM: Thymus-specific serine protease [Siphonaria sp. JEL0065]|nr:Thymus-specific serine protease [Siphonaria sp. JEL0065]